MHLHFCYGLTQKVYIPHLSLLDREELNDFFESNPKAVASNHLPIHWSKKDRVLLLPTFARQMDDQELLTSVLSGKAVDIRS